MKIIYMPNKEEVKNKEQKSEQQPPPIKFTVMPQEFRKPAAKRLISPKILIIGGAGLLLLAASIGSVLLFMKKPAGVAVNMEAEQVPSEVETPAEEMATGTPEEETPSLLAPLTPVGTPEKPSAPEIPPVGQLSAGADADADGLTDREEVSFQTDPTRPDTDGDGYLDGNEVFNLYNPAAPPPVTLLESGIVKLYRNASYGYGIYYSTLWSTSSTIDGSNVSFDAPAPDADSINITVMETGADVSLRSWYLSQYPQADINKLQSYTSKQGFQGLQDAERLNTYVKKDKKVFIVNYDLGGAEKTVAWYRALYGMMLNSLKIE